MDCSIFGNFISLMKLFTVIYVGLIWSRGFS